MGTREHWRLVYESRRPDEVSWYQASPESSLAALAQIGATPDMALADIGAGASRLADRLLDRGWTDITLVDISGFALEATRVRLGERAARVQWETADIRHWDPRRTFHVWHDRAVFHFLIEAADRAAYKRALRSGTTAGSHLVIATFAPDGPDQCSGLPVCRYDAGGLAKEFGSDFALLADWREPHSTPRGAEQRFQWAVFQRLQ